MIATAVISLVLLQALTPEVIEHAQAGSAAMQEHRFDTAVKEFQAVVAAEPDSAPAHANLGEAWFQKGDYASAVRELQRAIELNPKLMGAQQTLGVALLVQGDAGHALPHLEMARNASLLGVAYLETGRLGNAIVALKGALAQQPNDPDLLYYFGRANALAARRVSAQLAKSGSGAAPPQASDPGADTAQDVVALETALAKDPKNLALLGQFRAAAEAASKQAFEKVSRGGPASARAHQLSAEAAAAAGRSGEAVREYNEAIRLKPFTPEVHYALGNVLASEGKWPEAAQQFRIEASLRPANAEAAYRLGVVLLQHGGADEALAALKRAGELEPGRPAILLAQGDAEARLNHPAEAERCWRAVLSADPTGELAGQAHEQLAELYRKTGRAQEAQAESDAWNEWKGKAGSR